MNHSKVNTTRSQVKNAFEGLKNDVKLIVFTQEFECNRCKENRELMEELSNLSDKVSVEILDFASDEEKAKHHGVDKIPATLVQGTKNHGVRFYGLPGGYEFQSLIHAIKMVSLGEPSLSKETKTKLKTLSNPVHIQVFVTLTCPYCPSAVQMAHQMAMESDLIRGDMVHSEEFPHLTNKYKVFAVPKVVINEEIEFEGTLPEPKFLEHIMQATK
ncbi:hypothetical protein AKJ45_02470 [candidate division MSBL1 archaeon SCGC-AAA261F19]|uniref:Thioredoxin-like fold domain-containing protein n=2 Tax=candidate division MSBL1 TaxID=215777 RepID=A0A133V9N6_9EURY|nr:hypothetical protein AKJ43_03815 [candidate division MSBL1 archaeon SCGC-AAA261D19]KXB03125.1 hypothetical protein AKJ45_02470 [candidate division MSBL1 archaeon SCGC-AAA261F19]